MLENLKQHPNLKEMSQFAFAGIAELVCTLALIWSMNATPIRLIPLETMWSFVYLFGGIVFVALFFFIWVAIEPIMTAAHEQFWGDGDQ